MLVVILGRTGRTEFNLPATLAGTVVNIVLNLILIPSQGIVGAGIALVASYLVVLVLMYVLTQRLFPVPYEWGRLALLVGVTAATVAAGELLLPTTASAASRCARSLWLALPVILLASGFLSREERAGLRVMLNPAAVRERLRALGAEPPPDDHASRLRGRVLSRGLRGGPSRRGPALRREGLATRVVGLGRLAHPLAGSGPQRLASVEQVEAGVVARQHGGRERPQQIRPGKQRPCRPRGERAVVLSQVAVAAAMELDNPALLRGGVAWRAARGG